MRAQRFAVVVVVLLAACGGGAQPQASGVETVVDSAGGVVHVGNTGTPPAWRTERTLLLGAVDGGPEEFGSIRSVLADADGNIYVADEVAQEIRVFAPDGRHVRTIGRKGAGPGEFAGLYGLAWLDDEALAALDARNARIGILSREGEWLDAIRYFPISGPMIRLHPLGDDGFYAPVLDAAGQGLALARFTAGGPRDTIPMPIRRGAQTPAGLPRTTAVCRRPDGGTQFISLPEVPTVTYAFPPPGGTIAVSWTAEHRVAFLTPAGDTLRVVTRERPPLPYTDALYEEGMRPYREMRETFPDARCEPAQPGRPPRAGSRGKCSTPRVACSARSPPRPAPPPSRRTCATATSTRSRPATRTCSTSRCTASTASGPDDRCPLQSALRWVRSAAAC